MLTQHNNINGIYDYVNIATIFRVREVKYDSNIAKNKYLDPIKDVNLLFRRRR